MKRIRGFTLIELIVVVAIIGLLAAVVLFAIDESRKKGRDASRASQVQEFLKAAELYYSDNGVYPNDNSVSMAPIHDPGVDGFLSSQGGYMNRMPTDPSYSGLFDGYYYCTTNIRNEMTIFVHAESGSGDYCYVSLGTSAPETYCGANIDGVAISTLSKCSNRF